MYYIHHNQTGRDSATGVGFHAKDAVWNILVILCLLYSAGATMRARRKDFFLVQEGDTPNRGENDETMGLDGIGWDWGIPHPSSHPAESSGSCFSQICISSNSWLPGDLALRPYHPN
jgi:hypothetical protein